MGQETINRIHDKMEKSVVSLVRELARVRTGRASVALLEGIKVPAYGNDMPITQVASLAAPDPRLIVVQPWDKTLLHAIEKAIQASDLGLTPMNDGNVIKLAVPPLSGERRQELVKKVHKMTEESRIAIRNIRREGIEELKKLEKDKKITKDDLHRLEKEAQKVTDNLIAKCDEISGKKEKEIMEV